MLLLTWWTSAVHTSKEWDESLLCQGLALNDDLQRVLAKHEALCSGSSVPLTKEKAEPIRALVPVDAPLIDTEDSKGPDKGLRRSTSEAQLLALTPITTNGASATPAKINPKMDLLSGDDFSSPTAENSLAIVPVGETQSATPTSQQNALALVDMFSHSNNPQSNTPSGLPYSSAPQFQQPQNFQSPQPSFYPNGNVSSMASPQYEQQSPYAQGASPSWNGQVPQQQQQQQPASPAYGAQTSSSLPPPPWEAQAAEDTQLGGTTQYTQPMQNNMHPQYAPQVQAGQAMGLFPQQMQQMPQQMLPQQMPQQMAPYMYPQQQMYSNQMGGGYGYGYGYGYGQQQQSAQMLDQRMSGLSIRDDGILNTSSSYAGNSGLASYVHVPSGKPTKPEDKLFGDLVDFAKVKPSNNTTTPGRAGSM